MMHAPVRRRPEVLYALLTLATIAAIGLAIWGSLTILGGMAEDRLRERRQPRLEKEIAGASAKIAEDKEKPQALYQHHMSRGRICVEARNLEAAIRDFETAQTLARNRQQEYDTLLALADAQAARGDVEKALDSLSQAIPKAHSSNDWPYAARAGLHSRQDDHEDALADLGTAIALAPQATEYRAKRVRILAAAGRWREAGTAFAGYIRRLATEGRVKALENEVYEASRVDNFRKAIEGVTRLVELRPDDYRYRLERADYYLWTDQSEQAFADIEAAIRINPASMETRRYLGNAHSYVHRPEKALPLLNAAVARDPDDEDNLRDRGLVKFQLSHTAEAAEDFKRAIALDSPYSVLWLHLTRLKSGKPNFEEIRQAMADYAGEDEPSRAGRWPYPVMRFFIGEISEEELLRVAEQPKNDFTRRDQRCEALFYAGLAARLRGKTAHGTLLLERAFGICHPGFIEYIAAGWELRQRAK